jgi:uncharacterized protein YdaU (DUF1376 family)
MSDLPWFKFFPADWLSGTRGLTAMEAGVYITLVAMMYDHAKPLSMDETRLARYCGATPRQFAAALARLVEEGKIVILPEGLWNARVASELQDREEKICTAKRAVAERENRKAQSYQGKDGSTDHRQIIARSSTSEARSQKEEGLSKDSPSAPTPPELPFSKKAVLLDMGTAQAAVAAYNAVAEKAGLPKVQNLTDKRRKALAHRLQECGGIEGWQGAMARVASSDFLTGKKVSWRCDFDFILQASSFTKIMEGSYDNKPAPQPKQSGYSAQDALRGLYGG